VTGAVRRSLAPVLIAASLGVSLAGAPAAATEVGGSASLPSACQPLASVPETLQVAWLSRRDRSVGAGTLLEVMRAADLRAWIRDSDRTPLRLLQATGMAGRKATATSRVAERDYKVVVFDVRRDWLCRPLDGDATGLDLGGVPACEDGDSGPARHHRRGYTGCGYTLDTGSSTRGIDVFRVAWSDAVSQGFCLFPLSRFLAGG
jgi:hypothetical protein